MCRQGVVNTRQSGVFAALFTRLFFPQNVGGSVSLRSVHQVLVCHVGNVLAHFMSAEGLRRWGWQSVVSSYVPFRTLRQADYGVLLTRTNCLSVRSEQIVLWVSLAGWWKESTSLKCCMRGEGAGVHTATAVNQSYLKKMFFIVKKQVNDHQYKKKNWL